MHKYIPPHKIGIIPKKNEVLVPGNVYLPPSDYAVYGKNSGCFLFVSSPNSSKKAEVYFSNSYPPEMSMKYQNEHIGSFQTLGDESEIYG